MVKYALKIIILDHRQFRLQNNLLFTFFSHEGHYHQMT